LGLVPFAWNRLPHGRRYRHRHALASPIAVGILLAIVPVIAGIVQIFTCSGCAGRLRPSACRRHHRLLGGLAIYFQPLVGTLALTLVVAAVFIAKGVAQIFLSIRIRPHPGWGWIIAAGIIAVAVGLMILFRWPDSSLYTLGILAGASLIFTGWSNIMMAFLARR
jgi:uncharacterized membrane protein HdeD (DUF308 family)